MLSSLNKGMYFARTMRSSRFPTDLRVDTLLPMYYCVRIVTLFQRTGGEKDCVLSWRPEHYDRFHSGKHKRDLGMALVYRSTYQCSMPNFDK